MKLMLSEKSMSNRKLQNFKISQLEQRFLKKKLSKYTGGLVFEPKTGLNNLYMIVLDFNALYPSIMQEYNICFTTIHEFKKNKKKKNIRIIKKQNHPTPLP